MLACFIIALDLNSGRISMRITKEDSHPGKRKKILGFDWYPPPPSPPSAPAQLPHMPLGLYPSISSYDVGFIDTNEPLFDESEQERRCVASADQGAFKSAG